MAWQCNKIILFQNREGVASKVHRQSTIDGLKKFNARRKLKGAILTTILATHNFSGSKHSSLTKKKGSDEDAIASLPKEEENGRSKSQRENEIVGLTQQLITSITTLDFEAYSKLVDIHITAFEPEANGNLVEGVEFHKFYFDNLTRNKTIPTNTTILSPHVHHLGDDAACISYVRLTQKITPSGDPVTEQSEETRVWQRKGGRWVNVHVHRSASLGAS